MGRSLTAWWPDFLPIAVKSPSFQSKLFDAIAGSLPWIGLI
jgi:hypothetical protein